MPEGRGSTNLDKRLMLFRDTGPKTRQLEPNS